MGFFKHLSRREQMFFRIIRMMVMISAIVALVIINNGWHTAGF